MSQTYDNLPFNVQVIVVEKPNLDLGFVLEEPEDEVLYAQGREAGARHVITSRAT